MIRFCNLKTIFMFVLLLIVAVSCTLPSANGGSGRQNDSDVAIIERPLSALSFKSYQYAYGLKSAVSTNEDAYLLGEYQSWKDLYVRSTSNGNLRVQRDSMSHWDTVSEGQAYGMLLALYFGDKDTFNKLYAYAKEHFDPEHGLMHWKVNSSGVNISEFYLPIPHGIPYVKKDTLLTVSGISKPTAEVIVQYTDTPPVETGTKNYLQASQYDRSYSSATDADFDMTGALVFAYYRWKDSFYMEEAGKMIKNMLLYDFIGSEQTDDWGLTTPDSFSTWSPKPYGFMLNGFKWGNAMGWNPSYYSPAWLQVFYNFLSNYSNSSTLKTIFDNKITNYMSFISWSMMVMDAHMKLIDKSNNNMGLFPDWCNTYNGKDINKADISDRYYYIDAYNFDSNGMPVNFYYVDQYQQMSFNSYYDAVRVPWRMATYYNWFGSSYARSICSETGNFYMRIYKGGAESNMVDGYSWKDGSKWKWANRDGFNYTAGGQGPSVTFKTINACSTMVNNDTLWQSYAGSWYEYIKTQKEVTGIFQDGYSGYHYYGNTLRMISLLYLSGKFINYSGVNGKGYDAK